MFQTKTLMRTTTQALTRMPVTMQMRRLERRGEDTKRQTKTKKAGMTRRSTKRKKGAMKKGKVAMRKNGRTMNRVMEMKSVKRKTKEVLKQNLRWLVKESIRAPKPRPSAVGGRNGRYRM
ncbi:hypothetical protein PF005_g31103 [Phytophthora fragariae]|uniref:Uncharacterized protein n=1 Tax=Phytophthora fragariae TaxID=53985 RepID=A0A6A3V884_9STRA|nr:hypothetical protein PF003_g16027 [Phytophthora fragariae]KAE8928238.1 hypothetical protein PF009_g21620 [Phytophthora fragariae]KAE9161784.1 hypothetical protein PF005_g31103 [Phytophthora fragariae]KAE9265383.1 hypothetical protein PF001_g30912 [Phytophthora fragariae]